MSSNTDSEFNENEIKAEDWILELEQVAPQLVLRLHVDHKDWRTHVDDMEEQKKVIEENLSDTVSQLAKIAEEDGKVCERIQKREKMLSGDPAITSLLDQLKKNQEELDALTKKYKESEENISKLSTELNKITTELEQTKTIVDDIAKKIADNSPLMNIKEAIKRIKEEIRQMDLRIGVLQHTVLQAKLKTTRKSKGPKANSGAFMQDNFDPFSGDDLLDEEEEYM